MIWFSKRSLSESRFQGFLLGVTLSVAAYLIKEIYFHYIFDLKRRLLKKRSSESDDGDDLCQSLFYDKAPLPDGKGFPVVNSISSDRIDLLTRFHSDYKFLPSEFYKLAVENLPIVCVDVVCQRVIDGKLLLFYRRDAPAASIWWWPGGRLIRGETFFAAACRKIREETGNLKASVSPVGVINVWNTFFPDSNWDSGREPIKFGTQTVNVTVVCTIEDKDISVSGEASHKWAVDSHRWVSVEDALQIGEYDKYVRLNVEQGIKKGYITY